VLERELVYLADLGIAPLEDLIFGWACMGVPVRRVGVGEAVYVVPRGLQCRLLIHVKTADGSL
jgi:hypothetical protein